MAVEPHIWQPASGGDTLADGSWDTDAPAGQASDTGTFTDQPANNDQVVVGSQTYTWKTTLTGAADEIKIGTDFATSRQNFVEAVNAAPVANAGVTYGTGTTANADVTAVSSDSGGTKIIVTSIKYGTGPNSIVTTDTTTNFSWAGGGTLTGGVTTWTTNDAEIILNGDNHSALTANLDWGALLDPAIAIGKITKQRDNFSPIGAAGTPWVVELKPARNVNLLGVGAVYFEALDVGGVPPSVIIDGPEFVVLTGELQSLHLKGGTTCECSAQFLNVSGISGSRVTVDSPLATLLILDSSKENAALTILRSGHITNERDMREHDHVTVAGGTFVQKGNTAAGSILEVSGQGTLDFQPRIATGLAGFLLMSGSTTFANSKFDLNPLVIIIGHAAHVEFGPVAVEPVLGLIDLRKQHP